MFNRKTFKKLLNTKLDVALTPGYFIKAFSKAEEKIEEKFFFDFEYHPWMGGWRKIF
jgi:hypothetical protein